MKKMKYFAKKLYYTVNINHTCWIVQLLRLQKVLKHACNLIIIYTVYSSNQSSSCNTDDLFQ